MTAPREGVSTGSCAAGAAKAAALWLVSGARPEWVEIATPVGRTLRLAVVPYSPGRCGVVKDGGGDADATHGLTVIAAVELLARDGPVEFRAGQGVGVVTLRGLKVSVGEPAINPVPRWMIENALREVVGNRAAVVTISVPGGEEAAKRTFNARLGVVGGVSILGTRGTVRPLDEQALLDSLALELNTHAAEKKKQLAMTFGGTGEAALRRAFDIKGRGVVQVGNFIGFALDEAARLGFERILLGGHPGKLLKVAAGSFNTHNRVADGRMEALCAHAALLGMERDLIQELYACATTEHAIALLKGRPTERALWNRLAEAAAKKCMARVPITVLVAFIANDGALHGFSGDAPPPVLDL
jgi:cobalt-precorrin-5B (C1)-methyltransferase